MTSFNRNTVTRTTMTATATVMANVYGLGARFDGFRGDRPATALPPGATPSRGSRGIDPSQHLSKRDCQSPRQERTRDIPVATRWRQALAAKPANPN